MRDIKFRVWDDRLKQWCDPAILAIRLDGVALSLDWFSHDPSDVKIMSSTGKKDKNGKIIYESDFVRDRMSGEVYQVIFQKLCWRLGDGGELLGNYAATEEDLEVIGNIYESPELLTNN